MTNQEWMRFCNFFIMLIVGTLGGAGVYTMTADPNAKYPLAFGFIALVVVLGSQAIFR